MVDRGDTCGVIYIESVYFTALSSLGEGSDQDFWSTGYMPQGVSIACGLWGKLYIGSTIWLVLSIESAVALRDWLSCETSYSCLYSCLCGGKDEIHMFFFFLLCPSQKWRELGVEPPANQFAGRHRSSVVLIPAKVIAVVDVFSKPIISFTKNPINVMHHVILQQL